MSRLNLTVALLACVPLVSIGQEPVGNVHVDESRADILLTTTPVTVTSPYFAASHEDIIAATDGHTIDAPLTTFTDLGARYWLAAWPVWSDPTTLTMYHSKNKGTVDRSLRQKVWSKSQSALFTNPNAGGKWWIVNTYQHADGLLAFVHVEFAEGIVGSFGKGRIGLAWSTDNGDTFTFLGNIIMPFEDPGDHNIEGAPYVIKDGYFYVYFQDKFARVAVARAPVNDVINAAKNGTVSGWTKYFGGTWSQPGLGGQSSQLIANGITVTDAAYSTHNGSYYLALTSNKSTGNTEIRLFESQDAVTWELKTTLVSESPNSVLLGYQYLSIVDASGADNGVVGQKFYVYCVKDIIHPDGFTPSPYSAVYRWTVELGTPADFYRYDSGFSSTQGQSQWYYRYRAAGAYTDMSWTGTRWQGNEPFLLLWRTGGHPGANADAALEWVAPQAGLVTMTGVARDENSSGGDGVTASVLHNRSLIQSQDIDNTNHTGKDHNMRRRVLAGDVIGFAINKRASESYDSTGWDPMIAYTAQSSGVWTFTSGFSGTQGLNGWYYTYLTAAGDYRGMTWDGPNNRWVLDNTDPLVMIGAGSQRPGASGDSALRWIAPQRGVVRITGTVADADANCGDGIIARHITNETQVWSATIDNGGPSSDHDSAVTVGQGDALYFVVNKRGDNDCDNTAWDPTITYLTNDGLWIASTDFGSTQGANQINYKYLRISDGAEFEMVWDAANSRWQAPAAAGEPYLLLLRDGHHPGAAHDSELTWTAPYAGTVRLWGAFRDTQPGCGDGVAARILKGSTTVLGPWSIADGDYTGRYHDVTVTVQQNDIIKFLVNKIADNSCDSTAWNPSIQYQ